MVAVGLAALASLAGGIMANEQGKQAQNDANRTQRQALSQFMDLEIPEISDMELNLLLPNVVGKLDPETVKEIGLGPSDIENMDPTAKRAVLETLQQSSIIAEGGLREEDKAAFRDIQRTVNQDERARQKSIIANMAQRGVAGSGAELAARLSSSQASADRASQAGDRLASEAAQRALQGISMKANQAAQLNAMDMQKVNARDAINKYNAMNSQQLAGTNAAIRNNAQQLNLQNKQDIANQQVAIQNAQQSHNRGLVQQNYLNQRNLAADKAAALQGISATQAQQGAARAAGTAQIGTGVSNAIIAGSKLYNQGQDDE